jgi:hypothetical protein
MYESNCFLVLALCKSRMHCATICNSSRDTRCKSGLEDQTCFIALVTVKFTFKKRPGGKQGRGSEEYCM